MDDSPLAEAWAAGSVLAGVCAAGSALEACAAGSVLEACAAGSVLAGSALAEAWAAGSALGGCACAATASADTLTAAEPLSSLQAVMAAETPLQTALEVIVAPEMASI